MNTKNKKRLATILVVVSVLELVVNLLRARKLYLQASELESEALTLTED